MCDVPPSVGDAIASLLEVYCKVIQDYRIAYADSLLAVRTPYEYVQYRYGQGLSLHSWPTTGSTSTVLVLYLYVPVLART